MNDTLLILYFIFLGILLCFCVLSCSSCLTSLLFSGRSVLSGTTLVPLSELNTDGTWYMPLDMPGEVRTSSSWEECQQRCADTDGCIYFNSFPNGGCHITDGSEGTKTDENNPTAVSGRAVK